MSVLSARQFASYAHEQIRLCDVILAGHTEWGLMCSCGRVLPCSVALTATTRRAHFIAAMAGLVAARVVGRAKAPRPPPGIVYDDAGITRDLVRSGERL